MQDPEPIDPNIARLVAGLNLLLRFEDVTNVVQARENYSSALLEIANRLKTAGLHPETILSLSRLASALDGVTRGVPHPLFEMPDSKRKGGRDPDRGDVWHMRARVAGCLTLLMHYGLDAKPAAEEIARKHPGFSRLVTRPPAIKKNAKPSNPTRDLANAMISWRSQLENGAIKSPLAIGTYENLKDILPSIDKAGASEAAWGLLGIIEESSQKLLLMPEDKRRTNAPG